MAELAAIPEWYKLDNAAKIFPAVDSAKTSTMFRLAATLREPVRPETLQRAVEDLEPRFPSFRVRLAAGMFWHSLQTVDDRIRVEEERLEPCRTINARRGRGLLYRVLHFKRRISVELSHILTDGAGGLAYLRALVAQYLRLEGVPCDDPGDLLLPEGEVHPEELEDSFARFHDPSIPPPPSLERAFKLPEPLPVVPRLRITTGIMPTAPLLDLSRGAGASLTEYLAALYVIVLYDILMDIPESERVRLLRPIRLVVPVNLRKIFPSRTLRNFLLHVTPGIDPRLGSYTFDEALNQVHHFMRVELNEKFIKQQIARNMRGETDPFIRATPLFLKLPFERMLFQKFGNAIASGVLSNLGPVAMPPALDEHVERFEFVTVPNPDTRVSAGVVSHRESVYVCFGSLVRSREVERRFFTALRRRGVAVRIEAS